MLPYFVHVLSLFLGIRLMKESEFHSKDSLSYFVHWLTMVTAELLQEITNNENAADRRNKFITGKPRIEFVSHEKKTTERVLINVNSSEQPFKQDKGISLSHSKKRCPLIFGELRDDIGKL